MKFFIESTKNQALNSLKCKLKEKKWFQAMITFNPMKKSNQSFLFPQIPPPKVFLLFEVTSYGLDCKLMVKSQDSSKNF